MKKICSLISSLWAKPAVERAVHTAWQAALGAGVASFSGTHGDVKLAVLAGVAAAAAAVKTLLLSN